MHDNVVMTLNTMHQFLFSILNQINIYTINFYSSNVYLIISSIVLGVISFDILKNNLFKEYYLEKKYLYQEDLFNKNYHRAINGKNIIHWRENMYMFIFMILVFFNAVYMFCSLYNAGVEKNILDMFLNYDLIRNKEVIVQYAKEIKPLYEIMSLLCILFIVVLLLPFKYTGNSFINTVFPKRISERTVITFLVIAFLFFNFDIYSCLNDLSIVKGIHNTRVLESLLFLTVLFFITDKQSISLSHFKKDNLYFYSSSIFILQIIINMQFIGQSITNVFLFNILLLFMFFYLRDGLPLLKPSKVFSFCFFSSFFIQIYVSRKILNEDSFVAIINTYISFFIFFYKYYVDKLIKKVFKKNN